MWGYSETFMSRYTAYFLRGAPDAIVDAPITRPALMRSADRPAQMLLVKQIEHNRGISSVLVGPDKRDALAGHHVPRSRRVTARQHSARPAACPWSPSTPSRSLCATGVRFRAGVAQSS